jgi:mono/diheme cytochrome c family protein
MKRNVRTGIVSLVVLALLSCGSPRRAQKNMSGQAKAEDEKLVEGRKIFKSQCQKCHPNGEGGVGPSLNNVHLPGFALRYRIRSRSILLWTGRMPSFHKNEISKTEMASLIRFLKDLEKKDPLNKELTASK